MKSQEKSIRNQEITHDFLKLVDQYIADLLANKIETQLSTADFASTLHIASRHLTNTIKSTVGTSPCEIIENRIIKEAKVLLTASDQSISDISLLFAYNDTTNFIKFFKGIVGVTPLQYRKRSRA